MRVPLGDAPPSFLQLSHLALSDACWWENEKRASRRSERAASPGSRPLYDRSCSAWTARRRSPVPARERSSPEARARTSVAPGPAESVDTQRSDGHIADRLDKPCTGAWRTTE